MCFNETQQSQIGTASSAKLEAVPAQILKYGFRLSLIILDSSVTLESSFDWSVLQKLLNQFIGHSSLFSIRALSAARVHIC